MRNDFEPLTFGERIGFIKGIIGTETLAAAADVSATQIGRYIKSGSQPTVKPLVAMAKAAGVNLLWLAAGEGPVYSDGTSDKKSSYSRVQTVTDSVPPLLFYSEILSDRGINPNNCLLVEAGDEAMGDKVPYKADVLVDKTKTSGDGIYAIKLSELVVMRRLQFMLSGGVKVVSEHQDYEDYLLTAEEFQAIEVIGRRVWHGQF